MSVYRCFVEKKQPFATEANGVKSDLKIALLNDNVNNVRVINRYALPILKILMKKILKWQKEQFFLNHR